MIDTTTKLDRYLVQRTLHEGIYSNVYEAIDPETDERVALKVLSLAHAHRDIILSMFKKESDALKSLGHTNIVKLLHDTVLPDGRLLLALEYVPGGLTLERLLSQPEGEVTKPLWQLEQLLGLLRAIRACHHLRIFHRDIHPGNILVDTQTESFVLKLADFGVAKIYKHYELPATQGLRSLDFIHTPPYSSPEQRSFNKSTSASDLYAYGLVSAALLTQRLPARDLLQGDMPAFLEPLEVRFRDATIRKKIESLLIRAVAPDISDRPRIVEFEVVFTEAIERFRHRGRAGLAFTPGTLTHLTNLGLTEHAAFEDINHAPAGIYAPKVDKSGMEQDAIVVYGENLELHVERSRRDEDTLIVTKASPLPKRVLQTRRQSAQSLHTEFVKGLGGADEVIAQLYSEYFSHERQRERRQRRRGYFKTAQLLLDYYDQQSTTLTVGYRLTTGASKKDATQRFQRNDVIRLSVTDVTAVVGEAERPEAWDALTERLHFYFQDNGRKVTVGELEDVRPNERRIDIKCFKSVRLPKSGILFAENVGERLGIQRQRDALEAFVDGLGAHPHLSELILDARQNRLGDPHVVTLFDARLADTQSLIERALATEGIFVLQGPPGTGKTTHITEITAQLLNANPTLDILIASQANEATNNVLTKIMELEQTLKRGWRLERDLSAPQLAQGEANPFVTMFRTWAEQVSRQSREAYESFVGTASESQRDAVSAALEVWWDNLEHEVTLQKAYRRSAQVHGATLSRIPVLLRDIERDSFDWVIVDEAAKATDTELLIAMLVGRKIVLVGDQDQLPPYIDSDAQIHLESLGVNDYDYTLFERLYDTINPNCRDKLRVNYRMHSSIASLVSDLFYKGELITPPEVDARHAIHLPLFDKQNRVFWMNVEGKTIYRGTSALNEAEADTIHKVLQSFERELRQRGQTHSVAVITPYAAQRDLLKRKLQPNHFIWRHLTIDVESVNTFQGKERQLVLYSLVQTSPNPKHWRFVKEERRLNVAFSRAELALLVFGHAKHARKNEKLAQTLAHATMVR